MKLHFWPLWPQHDLWPHSGHMTCRAGVRGSCDQVWLKSVKACWSYKSEKCCQKKKEERRKKKEERRKKKPVRNKSLPDLRQANDASGFISLPSGFCGSLDMMLQETHVVMRYTHSKKRCPRALATVRLNYLWSSVTKAIDPLANTQRTRHAASWTGNTSLFCLIQNIMKRCREIHYMALNIACIKL